MSRRRSRDTISAHLPRRPPPVRITQRCRPAGDKVTYLSLMDAEAAIVTIRRGSAPGAHIPVRAYRCQHCTLWHLTSKPARGRTT